MTIYDRALARLSQPHRKQISMGLSRTERLLDILGRPQDGLTGALVAGTNGKGSVCAMLESVGRAAGRRTVLLTKPHLRSWTERIVVDGIALSQDQFAALADEVCDQADAAFSGDSRPTQFELLTAMGILAASRVPDPFLVCEVGLGGRLDSTNVLDLGAAIITNISRHHVAYLGDSVEEIAAEKAAILKPGNVALTAATPPATRVISDRAKATCVDLMVAARGVTYEGRTCGRAGVGVTLLRSELELQCPLCGEAQIENVALAATMAQLLGFSDSAIRKGVAEVRWPGRLQWIDGDPLILIDGAHNPAAMQSLSASIPELAEQRRVVVLFGAMQDKEVAHMLPILGTLTRDPVFTAIPDERAAPPESLASMFGGGEVVNGVDAAIELARERARGDGLVLVCGSLALAGAVIEFIDP